MKKILLVEPDDRSVTGLNFGGALRLEPFALELLAGAVPAHEVKIFDYRQETRSLSDYLDGYKPDIVGVTGMTCLHSQIQNIVTMARSRGAFTVAGGPHCMFVYPDEADAVVIGEGEGTFRELVLTLEANGDLAMVPNLAIRRNGEWMTTRRQLYPLWPLPRRCFAGDYSYHLFGLKTAMIDATRGCPHRCTFCVTPVIFQGRYRVRPPEQVARYIAGRPEPFIFMPEADFLASPKYAMSLLNEIIKSGIRKRYTVALRSDEIVASPEVLHHFRIAGLSFTFIGFEGQQGQLNEFHKDNTIENNAAAVRILDREHIISTGTFIVDPLASRSEIAAELSYAKSLKNDITLFSVLTPFPGTYLNRQVVAGWDKFDVLHAVTPTTLPYDDFQRTFMALAGQVMTTRVMLKVLRKLLSQRLLRPQMLWRLWRYARQLGGQRATA
jgi:radical SAM superfamily enzyme YgiQ (UPF0313 family)